MEIIQVVPTLPPAIDGLGDYALNLARQLRREFNKETHFVVSDPNWEGEREIEGFPISALARRSGAAVLSSLNDIDYSPASVLLHYVGYGYAKRGCPVWLIDGLQRWRTTGVNRFLVTMFHELYAFGPPWTSSFWLSPLQKNLAIRLSRLSDRILTSRQDYANSLHQLSGGKHTQIPTYPVFSNIGEPEPVTSLPQRKRRLVVFGHRNTRLLAYQQHLAALQQTCHVLAIEEVCDIGVPTGLNLSELLNIPIVEMGVIQATEISQVLLDAIAGFLSFPPPQYLAKSTIFAAYCAHRLMPILTSSRAEPIDGLHAGKHYWVAEQPIQPLGMDVGQAIADNSYSWYQTHSLSVQAKIFASYLSHSTKGNKAC
jgi:hypothetical protein